MFGGDRWCSGCTVHGVGKEKTGEKVLSRKREGRRSRPSWEGRSGDLFWSHDRTAFGIPGCWKERIMGDDGVGVF